MNVLSRWYQLNDRLAGFRSVAIRGLAVILATATTSLAAAAPSPQDVPDAQLALRVIGTWETKLPEHSFPFRTEFVSMNRDGTFNTIAIGSLLGSRVRAELEGKWRVSNGRLIFELTRSSLPSERSKVQEHRIVSADDETMVVESSGRRRHSRRRSAVPKPLPPLMTDVVTILSDPVRNRIAVSTPKPKYPPTARRNGAKGEGMFVLFSDGGGGISSVKVARSTGNAYLDSAAVAALRQWRFKPGSFDKGLVAVAFVP